jgi:hemerythrin
MEIKWEPSMSVHEETIDSQHKRLLAQINRLVGILSSPEVDMSHLRETIHFLYTYIQEHFSYEEGYMLKNKYPDLEKHKKMHQEFADFYTGFQKKLRDRGASPNFSSIDIKEMLEEAKKYLAEWLIKHIKAADQQYAKYIRSHRK